jgi:hypothetical protein
MAAQYRFEVDPARDLVRVEMSGFFAEADIPAFLQARHAAHAELACPPNAHLTLNDMREMKIQPQAVVDAFRAMLAASEYHARRLAFVVSPTLARTQAMRALDRREARCFEDIESAEAWLFAGDSPA